MMMSCCCNLPPEACKNCPARQNAEYQYTVTTGEAHTIPWNKDLWDEEKVIKVPKGKKVTIIIE